MITENQTISSLHTVGQFVESVVRLGVDTSVFLSHRKIRRFCQ
ncbi:hypothetical protein FWK35_00008961 [Aphis craccivora]|uniref:Uncharacterized protein n=1 Tax=Aphis craccivora TaxID=307492 RepID=A0A6G0YY27_APHCR|nr:hypothetical protein FWK35_00008961 [Aphis craccivora]